jgi:hypothetical protein
MSDPRPRGPRRDPSRPGRAGRARVSLRPEIAAAARAAAENAGQPFAVWLEAVVAAASGVMP